RTGDQRRTLVHFSVESTRVAPQVTGENGLPDGSAQFDGRFRRTDDIHVDVVERSPYLEEQPKDMAAFDARMWRRVLAKIASEHFRELLPERLQVHGPTADQ